MSKNNNQKNRFPTPRNSNQNNQSTSRFGGSSSRFGSSSSRFGNSSNNKKSGSRFGGSSSRFGSGSSRFGSANLTAQWTISPIQQSAVRMSLRGLGDPLHRLLGTPINPDLSAPEKVSELLSKDADLKEQLTQVLDEAWSTYEFRGAAILFPWEDNTRRAFMDELHPTPPPPPKAESDEDTDDDDDYLEYEDDDTASEWNPNVGKSKQGIQTLRAIDIAFVMNILARARANVVVGNTPLALEPGFFEKTLICNDDRIVKLAQATGCIDEAW